MHQNDVRRYLISLAASAFRIYYKSNWNYEGNWSDKIENRIYGRGPDCAPTGLIYRHQWPGINLKCGRAVCHCLLRAVADKKRISSFGKKQAHLGTTWEICAQLNWISRKNRLDNIGLFYGGLLNNLSRNIGNTYILVVGCQISF